MDLKRNFRSRTFALTLIFGGLIVLGVGVVLGRLGGNGPVWGTILSLAGIADIAVGLVALRVRSGRRSMSVPAAHQP
jgi:small-conductance mechanosensitive channel